MISQYFGIMAFGAMDEVKRDSPLGPALGNSFMGSNEQKWLKSNQEDLLSFSEDI